MTGDLDGDNNEKIDATFNNYRPRARSRETGGGRKSLGGIKGGDMHAEEWGGNEGDDLIGEEERVDGKGSNWDAAETKRNQKETYATINLPDDDEVTIAGDEGREY